MRTETIGAATLAAAAMLSAALLGACNDGSGNAPGTSGSTNTAAGAQSTPAAGSTAAAGADATATGGSGPAAGGSNDVPTAGTSTGSGGDVSTGGAAEAGGAPPAMTGGSGGALGGAGSPSASAGAGGSGPASGAFKILILSTTLEYVHPSIPDCQYMMGLQSAKAKATKNWAQATPLSTDWTADLATDDLAQFTDATLKNYAMVFSCSPTGTVFSDNRNVKDKTVSPVAMAAFQHYVEGGGAWGGVHSGTDFENKGGYPWFTNVLAGGYFVDHNSDGTPGTVQTDPTNASFPALAGVKSTYSTQDEWYKMNRDISAQPGFKILQRLAVDNRPLTWAKEIANPSGGTGGRMFYTVRGHSPTVYKEDEFRKLVLQGIKWATRR